jgi:hypothetical protein
MQAEKDKLEAERAENQRMMQELLALKAQLDKKNEQEAPPAQPASEAQPAVLPASEEVQETEPASEQAPADTTDEE